jgi:hypothetical protein
MREKKNALRMGVMDVGDTAGCHIRRKIPGIMKQQVYLTDCDDLQAYLLGNVFVKKHLSLVCASEQ